MSLQWSWRILYTTMKSNLVTGQICDKNRYRNFLINIVTKLKVLFSFVLKIKTWLSQTHSFIKMWKASPNKQILYITFLALGQSWKKNLITYFYYMTGCVRCTKLPVTGAVDCGIFGLSLLYLHFPRLNFYKKKTQPFRQNVDPESSGLY